jgi:hypothetical protein
VFGVSEADIDELEQLLQPIHGSVRSGKASSDGVWAAMLKWSDRGGRRGRKTREIMGRLDEGSLQEARSNYALWWSADVEVDAPDPERAREAAVCSLIEAFQSTGRTAWTVLHTEVEARRSLFGTVSEVRSGPHPSL